MKLQEGTQLSARRLLRGPILTTAVYEHYQEVQSLHHGYAGLSQDHSRWSTLETNMNTSKSHCTEIIKEDTLLSRDPPGFKAEMSPGTITLSHIPATQTSPIVTIVTAQEMASVHDRDLFAAAAS
jgi:hypothetical protein